MKARRRGSPARCKREMRVLFVRDYTCGIVSAPSDRIAKRRESVRRTDVQSLITGITAGDVSIAGSSTKKLI